MSTYLPAFRAESATPPGFFRVLWDTLTFGGLKLNRAQSAEELSTVVTTWPALKLMSPNAPDPHHKLAEQAASGDKTALIMLYRAHLDRVYGYIYRRVGHRENAEDLTAEVFTQMLASLATYQQQAQFSTWLLGIARHVVAHWWQNQYRLPLESIELLLDNGFEPSAAAQEQPSDDQIQRVEALLVGLPENYRQVLSLRFLRGYSVEETAVALNLQPGNVRVLQHRALKAAARPAQTRKEIENDHA
jgi:RNA polymerase sigma-70 factor, ECF subfamily